MWITLQCLNEKEIVSHGTISVYIIMVAILDTIKRIVSFGHKGPVLGVDIGSAFIKVVLIEKKEEGVILRNYGEIALGPRGGAAAGQATNLPPEKIAEALKELLRSAGIVPRHTFFAIPFSASLLSVVELPDVSKKELESMVPIEARRYIPVPISEVSLDWWVLPKSKTDIPVAAPAPTVGADGKPSGKIEVIIAAIHNDVIKRYELIKQNADIPSGTAHFEIEIFSTLRAVVMNDLSPTLVIDIGAGSTKLVLVNEGIVRGSHIVSSGGQDITLNLSRSLQIPFDKAEEIKCRVGVVGDEEGRDVLASADLLITNVIGESVRFAENYERKYGAKIIKVTLVGGGSRLIGLEKIVAKSFPAATITIGDSFAGLDKPELLAERLKGLSPSYAVAVGIAMRGLEE